MIYTGINSYYIPPLKTWRNKSQILWDPLTFQDLLALSCNTIVIVYCCFSVLACINYTALYFISFNVLSMYFFINFIFSTRS